MFTDNAVINGTSNDLTIFELGGPETFYVTINGITKTLVSNSATSNIAQSASGAQINAFDIDLSAYGVSSYDTVSTIRIGLTDFSDQWNSADISGIAAIHNLYIDPNAVPVPSALLLLLAGMAGLRRFRNCNHSAHPCLAP